MITLYAKTKKGRTLINLDRVDKITFDSEGGWLTFNVSGADYPMSFKLACDHDLIWARLDKALAPLHEGRHMNVVLKLHIDLSDLEPEVTS